MIEELIAYLVGMEMDEDMENVPDIFETFQAKYGLDISDFSNLDGFENLINDLIDTIAIAKSNFDEDALIKGFADKENQFFLMKKKVKQNEQ